MLALGMLLELEQGGQSDPCEIRQRMDVANTIGLLVFFVD
jgi:hypothetical protein